MVIVALIAAGASVVSAVIGGVSVVFASRAASNSKPVSNGFTGHMLDFATDMTERVTRIEDKVDDLTQQDAAQDTRIEHLEVTIHNNRKAS